MKFIFIFLLFFKLYSFDTGNCPIPYEIMYSIAHTERHIKRKVGYPYLISFNKKINIDILKDFEFIKLDNRTIDCLEQDNCIKITKHLLQNNIKNLDLGGFQINIIYHNKYPISDYFNVSSSYQIACNILVDLVRKYGWSWKTIGKYHSFTEDKSQNYYQKVANYFKSLNNR